MEREFVLVLSDEVALRLTGSNEEGLILTFGIDAGVVHSVLEELGDALCELGREVTDVALAIAPPPPVHHVTCIVCRTPAPPDMPPWSVWYCSHACRKRVAWESATHRWKGKRFGVNRPLRRGRELPAFR